jgi:hypothetical protein
MYTKAPTHVVRSRLIDRPRDPREVSDADWSVYISARRAFEPPREVPRSMRLIISTRESPEGWIGAMIDRLIAQRGS